VGLWGCLDSFNTSFNVYLLAWWGGGGVWGEEEICCLALDEAVGGYLITWYLPSLSYLCGKY
jgi:hypothetical protein